MELDNLILGKKVINKAKEEGEIIEVLKNGNISVKYENRTAEYCGDAFDKGYLLFVDSDFVRELRIKGAEEELAKISLDVNAALKELDGMIGLSSIKEQIQDLICEISVSKLRTAYGLKVPEVTRHMIFLGNAGTGKTTVARTIAKIYKALGVIKTGHLVETDRSGLVAAYEGQTAIKTKNVFDSAQGGVLFIDEAYSLYRGANDQFGLEAVDTLVKLIEDHREDTVVIIAGYSKEMGEFLESNHGLASRFKTTIRFDDYDEEELLDILSYFCNTNDYEMEVEALDKAKTYFKSVETIPGNARAVRNIFEEAIRHQSRRVNSLSGITLQDLKTIKSEDLNCLNF